MGNAAHRAPAPDAERADQDDRLTSTHFSKEEIAELMNEFKKVSPKMEPISEKKFAPLCQQMAEKYPNPAYSNPAYTKIIFAYSDHDGNKKVDVAEAITTLSIMTRGSIEEKATMIFHCFDKNGDSFVSREELRAGFETTFSHLASIQAKSPDAGNFDFLHLFHEKQSGITQLVDRFFSELDANHDGLISLEEFCTAAKASEIMCILLQPGSAESNAFLYELTASSSSQSSLQLSSNLQ